MSAAAAQLFQAMDGLGTSEDAIHTALRGRSPAEISAIRAAYSDHYPGHDLDGDLTSELSGTDLAAAQSAMSGDRTAAAAAALVNASSGLGTDEATITSTLEGLTDPAERQAVARAYEQQTGQSLDAMLQDELSGSDLEMAQALEEGDAAGARAVRIEEAMNGGFLGLGAGTDEDAVYSAIEGCRTQGERDALAASYRERTGRDLSAELDDELGGAERDVAGALLDGRAADAAAARLSVATEGMGTDESAIFRQLEGRSGPQRQAIIDAYNNRYGAAAGGEDFNTMIHTELGAMDEERARQLAEQGRLDPEFALEYAMDGVGTDEAMIRATLAGRSAADIEGIRTAFRERTGRDLDADLADENSGRDGFEISQMMQGEPSTPEERIARLDAGYQFERGSGAGVFGNAVMDVFSDNGAMLDLQHQRLEELGNRISDGNPSPEDLERLQTVAGYQEQDVSNYQASQDSVTNGLATGATVVVGAVVTIATAGSASPAVVAALAALAGGTAGMGVKAGMLGDSYSDEQIGIDAVQTLVSAASAGLLKAEAVQGVMSGIAGVAPGAQATLLQSVAIGAMGGGAGGLINSTSGALLDENTWRGEGNGLEHFLSTVGEGTLGGVISGASTSLAAGGFNAAGIPTVDPNGGPASMANGVLSGVVGGLAGTASNAATYEGRWEDVLGRFAQSGISAGVSAAADGYATGVHEDLVHAAARLGIDPADVYSSGNLARVQAEAANPTPAPTPAAAPAVSRSAEPDAETAVPATAVPEARAAGEVLAEAPTLTATPETVEATVAVASSNPEAVEANPHPVAELVEAHPRTAVEDPLAVVDVVEPAARTPHELAQDAQHLANLERAAQVTPEQRAVFDGIDQLSTLASTPEDWEYIRQLEHDAGRPVSERTSPHDLQASIDVMAVDTDLGVHTDGSPVTPAEHAAAIAELQADSVDPIVAQRTADHEGALQDLTAEVKASIAGRDEAVTERLSDQAEAAPVTTGPDGEPRREIRIDEAVNLGMGGAGSIGDASGTIGIEDASRPELWGTLGHKPMGQEADAISYGTEGIRTADVAEHPTAQPARASELALQVAAQRDASGIGTLGSDGPSGPLEFHMVTRPDGTQAMEVGIPVRIPGVAEPVVVVTEHGVDIATGMGVPRELSTTDSPDGSRRAQITPENAALLADSITPGEVALSQPAETFEGQRVLGIGGGPTSEWAMEHAVAGGAASVEVAGAMPRPAATSELGRELGGVEAQIRALVEAGTAVPPALTERHHEIVTEHVTAQRGRLTEITNELSAPDISPRQRELLLQEQGRIRGAIDPFLGSRVDRNFETLNSTDITHVQADIMQVRPIQETLPDGTTRQAVEVTYGDGTTRVVDQVIPSIGADPDAPGGINHLLQNAPPDMQMIPVIADGRVVGLESNPPGISVSGASMTGTLGTNMPAGLLERIPADMRDAVISSIIDHANRADVSEGSRGIVPGIENVGANPALMDEVLALPPAEQQAALEAFLLRHQLTREAEFEGEARFDDRTLRIRR